MKRLPPDFSQWSPAEKAESRRVQASLEASRARAKASNGAAYDSGDETAGTVDPDDDRPAQAGLARDEDRRSPCASPLGTRTISDTSQPGENGCSGTGKHWRFDDTKLAFDHARRVCREAAANATNPRWEPLSRAQRRSPR